jgi:hypothetical protein
MNSLLGSSNKVAVQKRISNFLAAARKVESLGACQILEKPEISENWLVTSEGTFIRKICGHRSSRGPCLLFPGWGTNHVGKGKCRHHARSLLYNPQLNAIEGIPVRFGELLEHVDGIEEGILLNVDHEIKFLYTLQQYVLTMSGELNLTQIETLQDMTMDIVKAKSIKNKIQKEMRLDASAVKDFVKNIFDIIIQSVPGPEAQRILNDVMNKVIVPYKNKQRITNAHYDFEETIQKTLKKVEK